MVFYMLQFNHDTR